MSLLYECINGIIQGGILEAIEGTTEGDEVAKLCVGKLRGMMVIVGDSNCKRMPSTMEFLRVSLNCSKICRIARFREDRPLASLSGRSTTRCHP
jgi:hypothetical protein